MGNNRWKWDPDNWPDQRINWNSLNRSHKSYAIMQYNVARKNRKLKPINNPFAKDGTPIMSESGVETVTPLSTRGQKIEPLGKGPLVQMFDKGHKANRDQEIKQLEAFFNTDEGMDILNTINESENNAESGHVSEPQPGPSGVKRQKTDHSTTEQPSTTKEGTVLAEDVDMVLPGTGDNTDMDHSGSRKGASSGGFSTGTGPEINVSKPQNGLNSGGLSYSKVHRILGYGLAKALLPEGSVLDNNQYLMTTSLLEIPVDRLLLYMNPGELAALPPGCYATSVSVSVVQRNPRVAFETASSTSTLATLNQNKFGIKAIGLNKKPGLRVVNRRITAYNATEPMIPTAQAIPDYNDLLVPMYGHSQGVASFNGIDAIPATSFMMPMAFPYYLCCWNYGNNAQSATRQNPGWYSLAEHVDEFDMAATTGTKIIDYTYEFKYAPLKPQLQGVDYMSSFTGNTAYRNVAYTDGNSKQTNKVAITNLPTTDTYQTTEVNTIIPTSSIAFNRTATLVDLIEQGQRLTKINTGKKECFVQPSVHIGISPVPRLTTASNVILPNSWTDVQGYYEVTSHINIAFAMPHHNTMYTSHNVEIDSVQMGVNSVLSTDTPIRFGKYPELFT